VVSVQEMGESMAHAGERVQDRKVLASTVIVVAAV
jgi:hypothetical protein